MKPLQILGLDILLCTAIAFGGFGCGKTAEEIEYEKLAEIRRPVLAKFCQDPNREVCFRTHLEDEISQCFEENSLEMERAKLTRADALRFCRTSVWKQDQWPGGRGEAK